MSLITHRCTKCSHPDIWRLGRPGMLTDRCGDDRCGCACAPGQPEVIPTWDLAGNRIERILAPGKTFAKGAPTCGCADCKALHKSLANAS